MKIHGWGRYPAIEALGRSFETDSQAADILNPPQDWIAHGWGKSYGDSALYPRVLHTRRFDKLLAFDPERGTVTCQSGVSLAELVTVFLPHGWFLKVTPGTQFISVGGAIASDVHGKNHHAAGCFSESVISFNLMLPDGSVATCSADVNQELFLATCGGMGLTGLILEVTLQLQPVRSAYIEETVIRCANLSRIFELFEAHRRATYSVAWIDCLAAGRHLGRSILMLGEHALHGPLTLKPDRRLAVPVECPAWLLNSCTVWLFNQLYYHLSPAAPARHTIPLDRFFYPLDRIDHWNRMYGRRGFTQYQCVLPKAAGFEGLHLILKRIAKAGLGSFLAVLKLLGPANANYLSFPLHGYTLALDFKIQPRLFPFLNELDRIVLDHGGRLYLAKDVRMSRTVLSRGYPAREKFKAIRARYGMTAKFNSLQSKRLGL